MRRHLVIRDRSIIACSHNNTCRFQSAANSTLVNSNDITPAAIERITCDSVVVSLPAAQIPSANCGLTR